MPISRKWLLLPLLLILTWVGMRALGDGPGGDGQASPVQTARGPIPPPRMIMRDGKWVRADRDQLAELMRQLAMRKPGLVRVAGVVRDTFTRQPVSGAEVVFASELGEASTSSGDDGRFAINIRPGFYRAFARADGYVAVGIAPVERLPSQPNPESAGVPRGELAPLLGVFRDHDSIEMFLRSGAVITGTVYDGSGRPVSGAVVTGRIAGYGGDRVRLVVGTDMDESDLDGSFRLEVPAGPIELSAGHNDYAGLAGSSPSRLVLGPGESRRVDLTVAAGCIIAGQVVDADGQPVGEGSLEAGNGMPPPNDFVPVGQLDSAGRFRLARTSPGDVRLRAWPWKS
ncbi:MAG: carboxypeptidase-like regulatory domain-containing protein, partial [Myxococcota bacterium]